MAGPLAWKKAGRWGDLKVARMASRMAAMMDARWAENLVDTKVCLRAGSSAAWMAVPKVKLTVVLWGVQTVA